MGDAVRVISIHVVALFFVVFMMSAFSASISTADTEAADSSALMSENNIMHVKSNKSEEFCSSASCNQCHERIFEEYADSMHAKSFSNPVFQA